MSFTTGRAIWHSQPLSYKSIMESLSLSLRSKQNFHPGRERNKASEFIKLVWVKFTTLSWAVLLRSKVHVWHCMRPLLALKTRPKTLTDSTPGANVINF
jgi:hypothetical protein